MKMVHADDAIRAIPDGACVVLPHGCLEPTALYSAFQAQHRRFKRLRLLSGLQFGSYPFLDVGLGENFSYATWQASGKLRAQIDRALIDILPLRLRDVTRVISRSGPLVPDVVIVQTTPPRHGQVCLGISVSFYPDLVASAPLVIAEINENMPWTCGATLVPVEAIDLAVESSHPLGEYPSPRRSARDDVIIETILGLVPPNASVQLGIGAIPEALLYRLHEVPNTNIHSGMLTNGLIEFLGRSRHRARVVTGEVAGARTLYDFVAGNKQVEFHPVSVTHGLPHLSRLPRFVSVNSAIEVDLQGQVNGESVGGVQISGVGGSLDFVEGAEHSSGGLSIIALPSTTEDGAHSRIVRRLSEGTPVTVPRFCADYVITEFGAARLRGKTLSERAQALLTVAHPAWHGQLAAK